MDYRPGERCELTEFSRGKSPFTLSALTKLINVLNGCSAAARESGVLSLEMLGIRLDGAHYVFGYTRNLSDLFLVEHLK